MPWGTLVNVAAVLAGGGVGLLVRRGLPPRVRQIVFQAIGLFTVVYGVLMALALGDEARYVLILVFSLLLGGICGELLDLQGRLERLGDRLKARIANAGERFTEGLITAFLIFCIGPMTILGAFDDGVRGDPSLLLIKSTLDCFMAAALASSFGAGVLVSVVPLFIFQYAITLLGMSAQSVFTETVISMLTATGGVLILGLGINILEIKQLRITNLLPALVFVVILTLLFGG